MERKTQMKFSKVDAELAGYDYHDWRNFKLSLDTADEMEMQEALNRLHEYEETGLEPQDVYYWEQEAKRMAAELGEIKIKQEQVLTNGDKIRHMRDEELAYTMFNFILKVAEDPNYIKQPEGYKEWIQQETEEHE